MLYYYKNMNDFQKILNKDLNLIETVDKNFNYIMKNLNKLKTFSTYNPVILLFISTVIN